MATSESRIRRLWRPRAIATVAVPLLFILAIALVDQNRARLLPLRWPRQWLEAIHYGLVLLNVLLAVYTVRAFADALGRALDDYLGLSLARTVATTVSLVLYIVIILMAIDGAGLNLSGLLVGGALTAVVVGIAGQASLSNIIAGLVILFVRPYSAGMYLTVRAGVFGGVEYSGQVWDISLFYTTLHSAGQEIRIPNSTMVAAVVVVRPQELDVYIPVTLPLTVDLPEMLEQLRRAVARSTAPRRVPQVTLEQVSDAGYIVGVRGFVAGEKERHAVERAIAGIAHRAQPPVPSGETLATQPLADQEPHAPQPATSEESHHTQSPATTEEAGRAPASSAADEANHTQASRTSEETPLPRSMQQERAAGQAGASRDGAMEQGNVSPTRPAQAPMAGDQPTAEAGQETG